MFRKKSTIKITLKMYVCTFLKKKGMILKRFFVGAMIKLFFIFFLPFLIYTFYDQCKERKQF